MLLALAPVWTLAILAVLGRTFVTAAHIDEYGGDVNRRILAYKELVKLDQEVSVDLRYGDTQTARRVSAVWLSKARAGLLHDVPPASASDDGLYGVRAEIEEARRNCVHGLMRASNKELDAGNTELAAKLLIDALEILDVGKYSSPHVVALSTQLQNSVLNRLDLMAPQLSEVTTSLLKSALQATAPDRIRLDRLQSRTRSLVMMMSPEIYRSPAVKNRAQKVLASMPNTMSYQEMGEHVNSAIALDTLAVVEDLEQQWSTRIEDTVNRLSWRPLVAANHYPAH